MQSSMAKMVLRGGEAALGAGSDEPRGTGSGRRREQRAPRRVVLPRWPAGPCERPTRRGWRGDTAGQLPARPAGRGGERPARWRRAGGAGRGGAGRGRARRCRAAGQAATARGGRRGRAGRAAAGGRRGTAGGSAGREEQRAASMARGDARRGLGKNRRRRYFTKLTSESFGSARRKLTGRGPVRSRKKPYARSAV
jgi:hypothetical protein